MSNDPRSKSTISGYTTALDCISMDYPLGLCIESMLGFCDEVIVVDGGSVDGTLELLEELATKNKKLKIFEEPVDFSHPRWGLRAGGYLKAKARAKCTGDYCWQMDADEIVPEEYFDRIRLLPTAMGNNALMMLPMIEFWGSPDRVRSDFFSWKSRFSVNDSRITHGLPSKSRVFDADGNEYPRPYESDGCNYIYRDSCEDVPRVVLMNQGMKAITNTDFRYPDFFMNVSDSFPPCCTSVG